MCNDLVRLLVAFVVITIIGQVKTIESKHVFPKNGAVAKTKQITLRHAAALQTKHPAPRHDRRTVEGIKSERDVRRTYHKHLPPNTSSFQSKVNISRSARTKWKIAKRRNRHSENALSSNRTRKRHHEGEKRQTDLRRKGRSPQYTLAPFNRGLRLTPVGLQYSPRVAALGYRTSPAIQTLGQYRGLIPSTNGLGATYRLPYNLQLARLLPALNLLQSRARLASRTNAGLNLQNGGGLAADVHVYKPNRLKYDSIPSPNVLQQALAGGQLGVPLLSLNPLNSDAGTPDAFGDLSDDANIDEFGNQTSFVMISFFAHTLESRV